MDDSPASQDSKFGSTESYSSFSSSSSSSSEEDLGANYASSIHLLNTFHEAESTPYRRGKKQTIHDFERAQRYIQTDYLGENPTFSPDAFKRRFSMPIER